MSKGPSQVGMVNHQAGQKKPLNEVKMLLVGQTGVGKTSLAKLLRRGEFNPHEENAKGISQITVDIQKVRLNVWDFGKDEIVYATYQFFLTKRSIYLLVLNTRLDGAENQIEHWLSIIERFEDSPTIIVGNKIDEQPLDIDRQRLRTKYKNIKDFVEVSYGTGDGLNKLKNAIVREVGLLEHIHDPLPTTWSAVKTQLEEMDNDHISYQAYRDICCDEGVNDDFGQRPLLRLLHDLGTILNFQEDLELKQTIILKPEWITKGVYKILNSNELFQRNGVLEREMLNRILDSREYPSDSHLFIMNMMDKFELCFEFEGSHHRRFLIPDLLSKQEPYTGEWNDALTFQYHYDVLPGSIISRFIVRMHPSICKDTYWRSGVVLEDVDGGNKALVKTVRGDKKILIQIIGRAHTRRPFLRTIRSNFDHIHKTMGIEPDEKVSLPDHPEIVVDHRYLLEMEEIGEEICVPPGLRERVNVKELLNGVEPEEDRRERQFGGGGITADGDVTINVNGPLAIGENIAQIQSIPITNLEGIRRSLLEFQEGLTNLNLLTDDQNIVNGEISAAIKEAKKDKPEPSKIRTKFESAINALRESGRSVKDVSALYDPATKIFKMLGVASALLV